MSENQQLFADLFSDSPSDWKVLPFQEAVDFQEGPGILAKDFHPAGIPLIRLKGIQGATANLDGANFLCEATVAKRWSHFRLQKGDLLLSSSASLGRVSEVDEATKGAVAYTGIIRMRPATNEVDRGYIKYFTQSSFFSEQIRMSATGSVINHFGPTHLKQMGMLVPTFPEQKAIAHILGTLDDKIELNRKTSETLDSIAKALFKSWFVDFDPVRAKAEGRPTGLPAKISALFPDSFEDSELGEIPSGWKVMELGMVSTFLNGYAFKSVDWQDNGVPVVKIGSVKPGFVDVEKVSFVSDEIASSKRRYRISPGDILIGMTGAYIGEFGLVPHSENPPLLNQRVGKVTQLEGGFISRFFLYNWMTNSSFKEKIKMLSHGSAQENISSETIQSICLTIPTKDVASAFDLLGQPIVDALLINNSEQIIISGLRDALLPKLISGEIRIPDAEKMLEEVGV